MADNSSFFLLAAIGVWAGLLSGLFGIGGGVVIVPALVYLIGFDQRMATGTSLAALLLPVTIGAVIEYYRQGNVDFRAAVILAITVMAGALIGALFADDMAESHLRLAFAIFVLLLGTSLVAASVRHLGWL